LSKNELIAALHKDLCVTGEAQIKHDLNHSKVKKLGGEYDSAITADTGHSLGEVFLRYISTHLTGHPLGQIIIKNDESFKEKIDGEGIVNSNVADTLINQLLLNLDPNGITPMRSDILHTLFEQMIYKRIERFGVNDYTKLGLPFIKNDKIVLYIDMKASLLPDEISNDAMQAVVSQIFPKEKYDYMDYSNGAIFDGGIWKIELILS
jgi:hypothetical protein